MIDCTHCNALLLLADCMANWRQVLVDKLHNLVFWELFKSMPSNVKVGAHTLGMATVVNILGQLHNLVEEAHCKDIYMDKFTNDGLWVFSMVLKDGSLGLKMQLGELHTCCIFAPMTLHSGFSKSSCTSASRSYSHRTRQIHSDRAHTAGAILAPAARLVI